MVKEGFYILIAVCIIAAIAFVFGTVAPQIQSGTDALVAIQNAPQRAQAKAEAEKTLAQAQANEINARAEMSKTLSLAQADAIRMNAQANVIAAQKSVMDAQAKLDQIKADEKIGVASAENLWKSWLAIGAGLLAIIATLAGSFIYRVRTQANVLMAQQKPEQSVALAVTNQGGSVKIWADGRREYDVKPPYVPPASQTLQAGQNTAIPATTSQPVSVPMAPQKVESLS